MIGAAFQPQFYSPGTNFDTPATLIELLTFRAQDKTNEPAYHFLLDGATTKASLTYSDLDYRARVIAAALQKLGISGQRALLLYPPGLEYLAAFFGCLYANVAPVPVYPPRTNRSVDRILTIAADVKPAVALTNRNILGGLRRVTDVAGEISAWKWQTTEDLSGSLAAGWQPPSINGDSTAFIQYTSGTTGNPKGVVLTHANVLHNLAEIYRRFGHSPDSRGVIWLPPYHDMGLIGGVLQPLYGGFPVTLMSPVAFLQHPLSWLQAISQFKATTSGGPDFAYDLCVRSLPSEETEDLDLSSWDLAFCGGGSIRPDVLERFTTAFSPFGFRREAFYPCYGLAEASLLVTGAQKMKGPVTRRFVKPALEGHLAIETVFGDGESKALISSGRIEPNQAVIIVDPETSTERPQGQVGEIWVSGPNVARSYWGREDESSRTLNASLAGWPGASFLRTGDLGFILGNELYVTGRRADLITCAGRHYYPQDIEIAIENSHQALRPRSGAAFAAELDGLERLVVVHEIDRHCRPEQFEAVFEAIRQAVKHQFGLDVFHIVLIQTSTLLKTSSGKTRRNGCRAEFLTGGLKKVAESVVAS
jgi:acyl-CoA synthetase (AMP-forming)/AMP-acid ligase II